jgi:hypothetical protein
VPHEHRNGTAIIGSSFQPLEAESRSNDRFALGAEVRGQYVCIEIVRFEAVAPLKSDRAFERMDLTEASDCQFVVGQSVAISGVDSRQDAFFQVERQVAKGSLPMRSKSPCGGERRVGSQGRVGFPSLLVGPIIAWS